MNLMVSGTSGGKLYLGEDISSPKEVFSKDYSFPGGKYSKRLFNPPYFQKRDEILFPGGIILENSGTSFREKILLLQSRKNNPYIREKYYFPRGIISPIRSRLIYWLSLYSRRGGLSNPLQESIITPEKKYFSQNQSIGSPRGTWRI